MLSMFRGSVAVLLLYAYRMEAMSVYPAISSPTIPSTNPLDLSKLERIADGCMIKNRGMRNLNARLRHTVSAYYRMPYDKSLSVNHEYDISGLVFFLKKEKPHRPRYFIIDVIKDWSLHSSPPKRNTTLIHFWSRNIDRHYSTVARWNKDIHNTLDGWLSDAEAQLEIVFYDLLKE